MAWDALREKLSQHPDEVTECIVLAVEDRKRSRRDASQDASVRLQRVTKSAMRRLAAARKAAVLELKENHRIGAGGPSVAAFLKLRAESDDEVLALLDDLDKSEGSQ